MTDIKNAAKEAGIVELIFWVRTIQASLFAGGLASLLFQEMLSGEIFMYSCWACFGSVASGILVTLPISIWNRFVKSMERSVSGYKDG